MNTTTQNNVEQDSKTKAALGAVSAVTCVEGCHTNNGFSFPEEAVDPVEKDGRWIGGKAGGEGCGRGGERTGRGAGVGVRGAAGDEKGLDGGSCRALRLFVANSGAMTAIFLMMKTYASGVVRTIERRFGLRSQQMGFLSSLCDVVHISLVIFVGYFGTRANKPRMLATAMLFAAVGVFLMATPHWLPSNQRSTSLPKRRNDDSSLADLNRSSVQLCSARSIETVSDKCGYGRENSTPADVTMMTPASDAFPAYYFFAAGQLLFGVGSSALWTLCLSYIDENAPTNKSALYLAIFASVSGLGSLSGFMLSAITLRLPENLLGDSSDVDIDRTSPAWIGNWWLGYLLGSISLGLLAIPLWFFPARLPSAPPNNDWKTENNDQNGFGTQLKNFPKALKHLLTNKLFLVNLLIIVCSGYVVTGAIYNVVRYMEIHFQAISFQASIIAALGISFSLSVGTLLGGIIMSRFKLKLVGGMRIMIFSDIALLIGFATFLSISCPQIQIAGVTDPANGRVTVANQCNLGCDCETSRRSYSPVCGSDNLTYFSSCFAGCTTHNNGTYSNCSCIASDAGGTARQGLCTGQCKHLVLFAVMLSVICIFSGTARAPSTIVGFRIVDDNERSFSLALNSFSVNLLAYIPAPILFGTLIDSTCKLWQKTCHVTGACLIFDSARLRHLIYGVVLGVKLADFILTITLFVLILRHTKFSALRLKTAAEVKEPSPSDGSFMPRNSLRAYRQYQVDRGRGVEYARAIKQATHF